MSAFTTSSDGWMQSNAGGPRWRTLDDGSIEIEGQGIVMAPTTGYFADGKFIDTVFDKWGDLIIHWSNVNSVPVSWTAAIMIVESRGKNTPANSAGAGGLMALLQTTMNHELGRHGNLNDPNDSLDAGTSFLAFLSNKYQGQLPAVAPAYNAGSAIPSLNTKCKNNINGAWQFDGTSAQNSMGFVEDCTAGHGSAYSIRATSLNNSIIARGLSGTAQPPTGVGSSKPTSFGRAMLVGLLGGAGLALTATLAEQAGWIRRVWK